MTNKSVYHNGGPMTKTDRSSIFANVNETEEQPKNATDGDILDTVYAINERVVENLISRTAPRIKSTDQNWISLSNASDKQDGWMSIKDKELNLGENGDQSELLFRQPPPLSTFLRKSPTCVNDNDKAANNNNNNNINNDEPSALEQLEPDNPWFKNANDTTNVNKTLGHVLNYINMDRLWNENAFRTTLGILITSLVRLFTTTYERPDETTAVQMLQEAMFRGSEIASAAADGISKRNLGITDNIWEVYRSRACFLVGWTKYRQHIEKMEVKQYITRKQKIDLNMLYVLLSSSDVRVHRETVDDNAILFIDQITGYELHTPPLLNRPLVIEIKSQDISGNIGKNAKLLDRSINAAANNVGRRKREAVTVDEILTLLNTSVPLTIEEQPCSYEVEKDEKVNSYEYDVLKTTASFGMDAEHSALSNMLTNTMIVSMMAEEFRVFVSDTPSKGLSNAATMLTLNAQTGVNNIGSNGDGYNNAETEVADLLEALPKSSRFRKPVFYHFHSIINKTKRI